MVAKGTENGTKEDHRGMRTVSKPKKKLMRNPHDKLLAGVCGGIADYLQANPTLIRLIALAVILLPTLGVGPFLYIVLWLFLPVGTQEDGCLEGPKLQSRSRRKK